MRTAKWLGAICLASGLVQLPAAAATFTAVDSGNNGELLTSSPGDDAWRVLYSVDVGSLSKDDILVVKVDAELTNNTSANVGLSSSLLLSASPTSVGGTELDESTNFHIAPAAYHGVPYKQAIYRVPSTTSAHYVNFRIASDHDLVVEQDYGRLQVLVIHPQ